MSIKLLALDLDGTLVADLHTIPVRTQAAIRAATDQGVRVTIATGREYEITRKFVQMLGLTTPLICYQGALIYDSQTDGIIASQGLPLPLAHELIDLARSRNLALNLFLNGKAYTEQLTAQSQALFSDIGTLPVEVDNLKQVITTPPIKGLIVHSSRQGDVLAAQLQTSLGDQLSVFCSLDELIEITSANVSKGQALKTLAAYYDIPQQAAMAIGDQDNDVEMIAWAGLGIAMGNASPKAKAAADYVAPPLSEEGAAWAIERFVLGQK
jgi:Cof subfamily protein (haloacid dehalogenase superfamily)